MDSQHLAAYAAIFVHSNFGALAVLASTRAQRATTGSQLGPAFHTAHRGRRQSSLQSGKIVVFVGRARLPTVRTDGRVVEGARLESVYT